MSEFTPEINHSPEYAGYGKNVEIILKFIRHGERDKLGNLTDYGREVTRQKAQESGLGQDEFDAVKAIGSTAGPKNNAGFGRSLETADIYAHEIAGDETFNTRRQNVLSYETLVTPPPYKHVEIYNAHLPEDFEQLTNEEKATAARVAQTATVGHLLKLDTPQAQEYKKEVAGSFAYVIEHYTEVAKRLKAESKVLIPAGTHGGTMEFLLQQAMVREIDEHTIVGFQDIAEIGGAFDPSDAFNVDIATNAEGKLKQLKVTFDSPNRPQGVDIYLDPGIVTDLAKHYEQLHQREI